MRWLALGAAGRGRDDGCGPPPAPIACARTGSVAGPVAGICRDLASGIIGPLALYSPGSAAGAAAGAEAGAVVEARMATGG